MPSCRGSRRLLIPIRVAWLPKHVDPFGIYRPQAAFFPVDVTVNLARSDTN